MYARDLSTVGTDKPESGRYTFVTLALGFWALRQDDFREAIEAIVMEAGQIIFHIQI